MAVGGSVARLARAIGVVFLALCVSLAWAQERLVLRLNPAGVESWGVVQEGFGRYAVTVRLNPECAAELGAFTEQHLGQLLEARLTSSLVLVARINAHVSSGQIRFPAVLTRGRALAQVIELERAVAAARSGPCFLPPGAPPDLEQATA